MDVLEKSLSAEAKSNSTDGSNWLKPALRLLGTLLAVVVSASVGSHLIARWVKIKTTAADPFTIGGAHANPPVFLAGSSLADYGIDWERVSTQLDAQIKVWGIAAGSPVEHEPFQKQVPEARTTFIVVSSYDLDESMICDYRAQLVPLSQAVRRLHEADADWAFSKRTLSQYPMTWLRKLFPTLGRSRSIMGKMRENVARLVKRSVETTKGEAGPSIDFGNRQGVDEYKFQRISDWSAAKGMAKIVAMRAGMQGTREYYGPKHFAFKRMLEYGVGRGRAVVIVLPVSSSYSKEFMAPEAARKFEMALSDVMRQFPRVEWLRLDKLPGLDSDANFCDLVHMNIYGREIATTQLHAWLEKSVPQP